MLHTIKLKLTNDADRELWKGLLKNQVISLVRMESVSTGLDINGNAFYTDLSVSLDDYLLFLTEDNSYQLYQITFTYNKVAQFKPVSAVRVNCICGHSFYNHLHDKIKCQECGCKSLQVN